ncbi:signal peptidase I [Pseudonocardiaceae bacterium YIM PH 21723]|nr:signal peptidase I [Pseudonocardiaceae bacterium YIM PH 21723]
MATFHRRLGSSVSTDNVFAPPPGVAGPGPKRRRWILPVVPLVLCVLLVVGSIFGMLTTHKRLVVPSPAMRPTIEAGEGVLIRLGSGEDVRRGDVVVFHGGQDWKDGDYIKRVVALGGDTVEVGADNKLQVNGKPIPETYRLNPDPRGGLQAEFPQVTVPPGSAFMLGDWRNNSLDSRAHGAVPVSQIFGTVVYTGLRPIAQPQDFAEAGFPGPRTDLGDPLRFLVGSLLAGVALAVLGLVLLVVVLVTRRRNHLPTAGAGAG